MPSSRLSSESLFALGTELSKLSIASAKIALQTPKALLAAMALDPRIDDLRSESRFLEIIGELLLKFVNDLGPLYGKVSQIVVGRTNLDHPIAAKLRLDRVFSDWPPMPFAEVCAILDADIPEWRESLQVEPLPLGVASMAQVHGAKDKKGKEWVVKVLKPKAVERLDESLAALEGIVEMMSPLALTRNARRIVRELSHLKESLSREASLREERKTLERAAERLGTRSKVVRIPSVQRDLCSRRVLVMERFRGESLARIVAGKTTLTAAQKRKLARKVLQETLVQIFEIGLFHADPHGGNLVLLEDGAVGLLDWGLAGELVEEDRRHIASVLKAVLSLDVEKVADALMVMVEDGSSEVERAEVVAKLKKLAKMVKEAKEAQSALSLSEAIQPCLKAAGELDIEIPEGLLMMVKTLITIEGLAKGIDPKVAVGRVATPYFLKAANPSAMDMARFAGRWVRSFTASLASKGTEVEKVKAS